MLHDAVNGKHMIDIPCLWPPAFSTAWHCAHLVLKIFSPDLAFPLGASPNDAMVQVKKTTCTYITFRNAVSLTFKISRRYCKDFLAYVDWQSLSLILPKLYKILLTKQASKPATLPLFSLFLVSFLSLFPPEDALAVVGIPGSGAVKHWRVTCCAGHPMRHKRNLMSLGCSSSFGVLFMHECLLQTENLATQPMKWCKTSPSRWSKVLILGIPSVVTYCPPISVWWAKFKSWVRSKFSYSSSIVSYRMHLI